MNKSKQPVYKQNIQSREINDNNVNHKVVSLMSKKKRQEIVNNDSLSVTDEPAVGA